MSETRVPEGRIVAFDLALTTACPVVSGFLRTVNDAFRDDGRAGVRPWKLDLHEIALSRSTPEVERERQIIIDGVAAQIAGQLAEIARQRSQLTTMESIVLSIATSVLDTMLEAKE